jgi:predicted adenine nucleotide alpha hydrolase (AANH) superfamily ATPase
MKLLIHICCANCGTYPINALASRGIGLKGLWFNPNIHPEEEYVKRLRALRTLQGLWGLDIHYMDRYGLEEFNNALEGHDGIRCEACYRMRLRETASAAGKMGLDAFTTTLLVSPFQKFDLILKVGRETEREFSIPFFFEDFRGGYREGLGIAGELGLYRQNYCGCLYSMEERKGRRPGRPDKAGISTRSVGVVTGP